MDKIVPTLFENKAHCCACGACFNICPRNAIRMEKDTDGFLYPIIDEITCVRCGLCQKVCTFMHTAAPISSLQDVYAATSCSEAVLSKSASGGIFAELAQAIIRKGGIVYGAAWDRDLSVSHIAVENIDDLCQLQGSKYVQSNTNRTFAEARQQLELGRPVLYCGTPCQISGLYGYLGKSYDTLYTVDLICHGVPNTDLLNADLQYVSRNLKAVRDVTFRDKCYGWGTTGSYTLSDGTKHRYSSLESPYYFYFLSGAIYRDSCYNCRFPSSQRVGDITLGDYWGIESAHRDAASNIDINKGVSCILVNTQKGHEMMRLLENYVCKIPSELEKVQRRNGQLVACCKMPVKRQEILEEYRKNGYSGVVSYWKKHEWKNLLILRAKSMIPTSLKQTLKRLKGRC